MENFRKTETQARVSALLHNSGGTYMAAQEVTGVHRFQLSRWHRGVTVPRTKGLETLRNATS